MQNKSHAVMQQRHEPADSFDLFPTPGWATRGLCEFLSAKAFSLGSVWEPACGLGHVSRPLFEYFATVHSSDVVDYGHGDRRDFLIDDKIGKYDLVITNPPYKLAEELALRGLELAKRGVALLVRTSFLEGKARYENLFSKQPPSFILQFCERVPMFKGRVDKEGSTATSYAWIVWLKSNPITAPAFHWIKPCRKRLERDSDYEATQ